jgi:heptosyltransferase I
MPDAEITWVVGKNEYELFKGIDGIEFLVVDKSSLLKAMLKIRQDLGGRRFDVLLNMHASMSANLISAMISSDRKVGFDKARARDKQNLFCNEFIPAKKQQHVADGMVEFVNYITKESGHPIWESISLSPEESEIIKYIDGDKTTCVISPCSAASQRYGDKQNRSWPVENSIEVINYLLDQKNIQVIVTGGLSQAEIDYSNNLKKERFTGDFINLIGKTSIRGMAAIIKYSQFVISPDSGPAHIGTVMNKPVIGLHAMTNPNRSGAYNSNKWIINKYPEAVKRFILKKQKTVKWGQKVKEPKAMQLIKVNDVKLKIDEVVSHVERSTQN